MPTISACIIAKNEEKTIEILLKSIINVVDEIIVVDTGSTDRTVEICEKYKVKLIKTLWENNFSKARNLGLEKATKEWIIYLDCDEYLAANSKNVLRKNLNNRFEAYTISLINIIDGKETLESQSLRVFKNRKDYRFKGRIHEQIAESIVKKYGDKFIQYMPLRLFHTGYEPSVVVSKKKNERNFEIFQSYEEHEKDGFYYYNLAGEYSRAGNVEKACENYKKAYTTPAFENGFREYLHIYLVKALFDQKKYMEALEYCNKGFEKHPYFPDLHFLAATCNYTMYKYSKAYNHLIKYKEGKRLFGLNYPDFKLNESNDMEQLISDLKNKGLFWENPNLTIIVDASRMVNTKVFETIAELSDDINVILSNENIKGKNDFINRGYKVFSLNGDLEDIENKIMAEGKEYILKLKCDEYITAEWAAKIKEYVESNATSINAYVLDENSNFSLEKRLINRNNSEVDSEENFLIYHV